MGITPPLRYIHIDDYGPVGIDTGPDDVAFAAARADLAATGYRTLVIGPKQYWLQNGFCLNAYTDANGVQYPALPFVHITSDSSLGLLTSLEAIDAYSVFSGLPATIILSPGYADPSVNGSGIFAYSGGSEPCRTTGSIQLTDSCSITNLRIISWAAYQVSRAISLGVDSASLLNSLVWGLQSGMAAPVLAANGMLGVSAGGGTAIQFDGSYCKADNLVILGFRNGIVSVPPFGGANAGSGASPSFGAIQGDTSNLIRVDLCGESGPITGPIQQLSSLTTSLPYGFSSVTATADSAGGTNLNWKTGSDFGPLGLTPAVGDQVSITAVVAATGGPLCNAANLGALNPAGNVTNRYLGVVVASGSSGTINLPGMPIESFFDASSAAGAVVVANIAGATMTISSVESGVPAVGQWVTSSQVTIPSPTSIISTKPISAFGNIICTLSNSLSASTGMTFTLVPGVSAVASITGSTLVASNISGGTLAVGQLITGAGVAPGTTITGSVSGGTYTVNSPVLAPSSVFTAFTGEAFTGSITGSFLTVLSTPAPALAIGSLLSGTNVPPGTSITGSASSVYTLSSSLGTILAEDMTASAGEILVGSISGNVASFSSGTGIAGQLLTSSNTLLLPNTYLTPSGGGTGVNVFQSVGSAPLTNGNPVESVAITAVSTSGSNAAVFGGYITPGTGSSTLHIAGSIAVGALASGQTLLGEGIPPNTTITYSSGIYTIGETLTVGSASDPLTMIAVTENVVEGSISGTVLTVSSVGSSPAVLSAGPMLSGGAILPGTYISSMTSSAALAPGSYSIAVPQLTPPSGTQALASVPYATFPGSISGNTLTVSPYGTFAVGQEVLFANATSLSTNTTIVSPGSVGTSNTCTYTISGNLSVGPEMMTAIPGTIILGGASCSGTINAGSNLYTVTTLNCGTLAVGQQLLGPTFAPPAAYVTSVGSGTCSLSSTATMSFANPCLAAPPQSASFSATISGATTLVVTSVSGTIEIGQQLIAPQVPASTAIYIATLTSPGTYTLSGPCTNVTTATPMISFFQYPTTSAIFAGTIGDTVSPGTNLVVANIASGALSVGQQISGPGINAPTYIVGNAGPSTYVLSSAWSVGTPAAGGASAVPVTFIASPPTSALFEGTINSGSNLLTVTSLTSATGVASGAISPGQALVAGDVVLGTTILSFVSGSASSGPGTYALSASQTITATGTMAAFAPPPVFTGSITGSTLVTSGVAAIAAGATLTASGLLPTTIVSQIGATGHLQYKVKTPDQYSQTVASQTGPIPFKYAASSVSSTGAVLGSGSISGTTLSFLPSTNGTLGAGSLVKGANVIDGTTIVVSATASINVPVTVPVNVPQQVSPITMSALSGAQVFPGSIVGTQLLVSNSVSGLTTGMILIGPGVAFGSYITVGSTISVTVPQYITSSTFGAMTAGLVSGSISGSASSGTASTALNVGALSFGTAASPQIVSGPNVPFGTTIAAGSVTGTGVVAVSTSQTVTNQAILALNPVPPAAVEASKFLNTTFTALGVRPGRTIDLFQSNQVIIGNVRAFASGTIIKSVNNQEVRVQALNCDCNVNDLSTTAIDIEGTTGDFFLSAASVINIYTAINNGNGLTVSPATSVMVSGSALAVLPGGNLINHNGQNLQIQATTFGGGSINVGPSATTTAFDCVIFGAGAPPNASMTPVGFQAPTEFAFAIGAPVASFDPTCVNVPLGTPNSWGSPGTSIRGNYSAFLGGSCGSDEGRIGYLVVPSAAELQPVGSRQTAKTSLGGISNSSTTTASLTSDGSPISTGSNSISVENNGAIRGVGRILAYSESTAEWAIWNDIEFLLLGATSSTPVTLANSNAITPVAPSQPLTGPSTAWRVQLSANTTFGCLNALATAAGSPIPSVHWLFDLEIMEVL